MDSDIKFLYKMLDVDCKDEALEVLRRMGDKAFKVNQNKPEDYVVGDFHIGVDYGKKIHDIGEDMSRYYAAVAMGWDNVSTKTQTTSSQLSSLEIFLKDRALIKDFESEVAFYRHTTLKDRTVFDNFYKKYGQDKDAILLAFNLSTSQFGQTYWLDKASLFKDYLEKQNKNTHNNHTHVSVGHVHNHNTYTGYQSGKSGWLSSEMGSVSETTNTPKDCCDSPNKYKNIISSSLKFWCCKNCGADLGDINES